MVDFRIRVVVDPKNAVTNTKRVDRALDRTATKADNLRASMARMFAVLGGITVLTGGIRLLANYSQAMSTVQAVTSATEEEFRKLTERAQDLGRMTRFSAAQAAEGMVFLGRAGFSVSEVMATVGDTLLLAQAGALSLDSAAQITSTTLRAFRLEVDQVTRVTDVYALAANSATTDVTQLAQGMKFAGSIAKGLGVSLETTVAAMAALSDANLQASMAGTGLRRVMAELESPGKVLQKVLKVSRITADDVRISSVGLTEALKALKKAGVGAGEGLQIFGQRGGPAFEILVNSIPKIDAMNRKLLDAEGTAKRVAETMDLNLKGALLALRSAWEGLILKVGDAGEESSTLTGITRGLTTALRALGDNAETVGGILKAILILLGVKGLLGAVRALTIAIASNPIGFMLTALALGVTLLIAFKDKIKASSDGIATMGDVFAETWVVIKEVIAGLNDLLLPVFDALGIAAEDAFGGMAISIKDVLIFVAKATDSIAGLFKGAYDAVLAVWDHLDQDFAHVMNLVQKVVRDATENMIIFMLAAFQTLGDVLRNMWAGISNSIASASLAFNASLRGDLKSAQDNADNARDALNLALGELKRAPQIFEDNALALADKGFLPEVEITKKAADIGKKAAIAFAEGFAGTTGAEDLVTGIFTGAEARAAARAAKEAADKAREGGLAPGQVGPPVPGGIPEEGLNKTLTDYDKLLTSMVLENELLDRLIVVRGAAGAALKVEAEAGMDFTKEERKLIEAQAEENALLKEKNRIQNELLGPQEQLTVTQKALNQLLVDSIITQEQYNQKLREAKMAADQASTSISAGFTRGLEQIKMEIEDVGALMEDVLVNAFHAAEDALVKFVRTGQFNFKEFANSLLDDITRLIVRLLVLQTIQAFTGAGPTAGLTPKQVGGPVQANKPFLVGEQGPEIFVPQGMGNIVPADETAAALASNAGGGTTVMQAPAPEVKVQVVNVSDPNEIPAAMDSPSGEQTVMNIVSRNKDQIKRLLQ